MILASPAPPVACYGLFKSSIVLFCLRTNFDNLCIINVKKGCGTQIYIDTYGQVTKVQLPCYLVLLSTENKTR